MKVILRKGNIAEFEEADAIVNAANSHLSEGTGVCGAIHKAGGKSIAAECAELRRNEFPKGVPVGEAVATNAGDLPVDYVIHAVGPHYWNDDHEEKLVQAYQSALRVADEIGVKTVAFPAIATGVYGYPTKEAAPVVIRTLNETDTQVEKAFLVLFDDEAFVDFFVAAVVYDDSKAKGLPINETDDSPVR